VRRGLGVALGLLALGAAGSGRSGATLFSKGLAPVDLGATAAADRSAAACLDCHADTHAEWSASRHAVAWTNGIFQREFRREPLDWCVRCHAPLAPGDAASVDAVAAEGVNCAVCHLRDGVMLASAHAPDSPHLTEVVSGFGSADYCGGCHQFAFPFVEDDGAVRRYTDHPMQNTVAEFRASAHRDIAGECLGCHGTTPAGHRFPGAHDLAALQHAAELHVCADGPRTIELAVRNVGAGHALPTGDLHRHLQLRAWRSSAPASYWEAFIGRAFESAPDAGKQVRVNTSIPPLATSRWTVPLRALGGEPDETVSVELRYVYTADEIPTDRNHPGEPTSRAVHHRRVDPSELPPCSSTP